ncbi:MAG: hypothetical protein HFE97_12160 [Oscillospiraceae bacterium]|nr:hypothetical protein [Oscillospiraceae bacterium]
MSFLTWCSGMRELSHYILTRGILLSCALLTTALAVFLQARRPSADALLLLAYGDYIQTMACVVLGAGLIGSALMEDILTVSP